MSGLDRIIEAAPSYEKLFARWQRQHWSTEDFDFTEDARQWADPDMFTDEVRQFLAFGFSEFFIAEDRVTVELLPFAIAAPHKEAQLFLTTQISDEAKHVVFWDRFYREVFNSDADGIAAQLNQHRYVVNKDWETMFDGILHECAEDLRKDPSNFEALVRGVTVYMVVIEGMLALTAARFMIKSLKDNGWFPGFVQGFTAVNRDESRHVGFGVKFLADAIKADPQERRHRRRHAQGVPAGGAARLRAAVGRRPVRLRDALLPLVRDLRVRDEGALEEARGDGPRPGDARRAGARLRPAWRRQRHRGPSPGRPSTGARERILEGCLEVLKESGYAGLTIAKVAAASGESKALVSYHFGSKDGLVAAAGRELGEEITREVLDGARGRDDSRGGRRGRRGRPVELIERDERLPRVYFDLNAVSVVDPGRPRRPARDQGRLARRRLAPPARSRASRAAKPGSAR